MKRNLIHLLVGQMSLTQRCVSVAAGVALALMVAISGLTFSVGLEAVPSDKLKLYTFEDKDGYCSDDAGPCGELFACKDECEEDDNKCCPSSVTKEVEPTCLYGCYP